MTQTAAARFAVTVDQYEITQDAPGDLQRTSYTVRIDGAQLGRLMPRRDRIVFHPFTSSPVRPSQEQIDIFAAAVVNEKRRRRGLPPVLTREGRTIQ